MAQLAVDREVEIIVAGQLTPQESINREHRLARESHEFTIQHAVRCGELLIQQKAALNHGEFKPWIAKNCEFSYRQAARYIQVKKKSVTHDTFDFSSINQALGYDKATHVSHNSGENEWYTASLNV